MTDYHASKLVLRALEPGDIDLLYLWENEPDMWRYGFSPAPLSRHQIWEYITQYDANPLATGQLRLMMQVDDKTVGAIDLYNLDMRNRHAFIGIMTATEFRKKGYASRALDLISDYCRYNLGLEQIVATVAEDNVPSMALFNKCGFTQVASLPRWIMSGSKKFISANVLTKYL